MPGIEMFAQMVAERAVNSIAGGLLITAVAWLVLRLVGRQNSGTRFAVWFAALIAIAGLPFVPGFGSGSAMTHAMRAEITLPGFWAIAIFSAWIVFAIFASARMITGLWKLRSLRRSAVELEASDLQPELREILAQCQAARPVKLCSSSRVSVPTAIGFFRPAILIPAWALAELPVEELKIILLHEFAHLRRRDDWTNLAQKSVRTLFFFHPAVWWIEQQLSLEREMACDDAVLAETRNPRAYAECLVALAEKSFLQRSLALAQAAISRACETSARLAKILDTDRPPVTRVSKPALGLMAALAAACLVLLPDAPRLIAFENTVPPTLAAGESFVPGTDAAVVPATLRTAANPMTNAGKAVATPAVFHPAQQVTKRSLVKPVRETFGSVVNRIQPSHAGEAAIVPVAEKQNAPAPQFLLVMRSAEFDEQGTVFFSVTVWKLTFANPDGSLVQQGVPAKSI